MRKLSGELGLLGGSWILSSLSEMMYAETQEWTRFSILTKMEERASNHRKRKKHLQSDASKPEPSNSIIKPCRISRLQLAPVLFEYLCLLPSVSQTNKTRPPHHHDSKEYCLISTPSHKWTTYSQTFLYYGMSSRSWQSNLWRPGSINKHKRRVVALRIDNLF